MPDDLFQEDEQTVSPVGLIAVFPAVAVLIEGVAAKPRGCRQNIAVEQWLTKAALPPS
jgi:hypothetical protein